MLKFDQPSLRRMDLPTSLGKMVLFGTPEALVKIWLPSEIENIQRGISYLQMDDDYPLLREAQDHLIQYFNNMKVSWEGRYLPLGTDFQSRVWSETVKIPYGETRSYGELAKAAGSKGAARAVGHALARNPMPILIPCHRVIGSKKDLCGFGGGLDTKSWLLTHEGVVI